jgi:4-hydroxy-tetrahydrodipicolinate reductase
VVHGGTGETGTQALGGIINHPDLELVGLYVSSPEKAGKDAGELCGLPPVGVVATTDMQAMIDLQPHCMSYCGNGLGREADAVADIARFLERGINVATISLLNMLYPPASPPELRAVVDAACKRGGSTFLSTGLDPGFTGELLPITLLSLMDEIHRVQIQECNILDHYPVESVLRDHMGFGMPPDYPAPFATGSQNTFTLFWGPLVQQIADLLDVTLDELRFDRLTTTHPTAVETSIGTMEAGTVVAMRLRVDGIVDGEAAITCEHVTRIVHDVAPDWPRIEGEGEACYRLTIEGNPNIRCELDLGKHGDVWGSVSGSAMRLVNHIPGLCSAPPGHISALSLPPAIPRNPRFGRVRVQPQGASGKPTRVAT